MSEPETPLKPKRHYVRKEKKVLAPAPIVMPPPPIAPTAQAHIDKRLSELLAMRAQIQEGIAQSQQGLTYWQTKFQQMQTETQDLLNLLRQLTGQAPMAPNTSAPVQFPTMAPPMLPVEPGAGYSPFGGVPPGVGSIPANKREPTPNPNGNSAEMILKENGFS